MVQLRVSIDVDDLERAITFYTRALGLTVGRRKGGEWAELLGATAPVDLLTQPAGTPASPRASAQRSYDRHWTPVHLDVVVPDLEAAIRSAEEAGAAVERAIQVRAWGRMANLGDPFGHGLCLLEFRGRGYDELLGA